MILNKRRVFGALLLIMGALAAFGLRLFWLQGLSHTRLVSKGTDLVPQSVLQREQRLMLDSGRGDFYDRSGKPLTGEEYPALLVFPVLIQPLTNQPELENLCRILGTDTAAWTRFRHALSTPRFWSDDKGEPLRLTSEMAGTIENLGLEGLAIVPYKSRYLEPFPAAQLLGYMSQDPERVLTEFSPMVKAGRLAVQNPIGAAGLEKTFEPLLRGLGGDYISLYTDATGRPIKGLGYRMHAPDNPYYPLRVITTLVGRVQSGLEKLADKTGLREGAIVVLDAQTAEVVAMVSRPTFDPRRVDPLRKGWSNQALLEAAPGSVFKTVVAAAALEFKVAQPDEEFECKGAWGKYHFTCWKKEGHGTLTFRQAYAASCNIVFGQIMKRLKPEQLEETARKLGVGLPAGWQGELLQFPVFRQLDKEETGGLWAGGKPAVDEGALLQTAIGQRDVRMTPLQAANMVVTLLNGGKMKAVRAVGEIQYGTGRQLARFPEHPMDADQGRLSARTSAILLDWMRDVVVEGTGTALKGAVWGLAGKSGTAQAPEGGKVLYHQWFAGYGPVDAPRYAVAVVSKRQRSSGPEAVQLFRQAMELLAEQETSTSQKAKEP